MQTFRGVVLPVLRLLVWSVIAVALVVLAFGVAGAATRTSTSRSPPRSSWRAPRSR